MLERTAGALVAAGDPHTERSGPDNEAERRAELDCLAVDAGVDGCGGDHLELLRRPGSRGAPARSGPIEHDDAELPAVERRTGGAGF